MNEPTEPTASRAAARLKNGRSPCTTGLALLALSLGGALLSACPGGSFTIAVGSGGDGGGDGGVVCSGTPSSNPSVLNDNCGVFVATDGNDEDGDGTKANPYQTLGKAIEAAGEKAAARVFVCSGTYTESVVIPGGLELFGGLACPEGAWAPGVEKSVIAGIPNMVAARMGNKGPIVLEGFSIVAASAMIAGGSSIAVLAEPAAKVELRGCDLTAGDAAEGAKGTDGNPAPPMTPVTDDTNKGLTACMNAVTNPGGFEHVNTCGAAGDKSIGGPGGAGFVNQAAPGATGIAEPPPATPTGGGGVVGVECGMGGDGQPGTAGADGDPGMPGQGSGALSVATGFRGVPGGDGAKGKPGQGGGGGSGQKGTSIGCPNGGGAGASGGSGGTGGCGGEGGGGGKAGGSSIALVSIDASVTLSDVRLQTGNGGKGGAGGSAQVGGVGATGAVGGGDNGNVALKVGCMGGDGGPGGKGGAGAGGSGGHSIAIAYYGAAPTGTPDATLGKAGAGGDGVGGSSAGTLGQATKLLEFDAFNPG